MCESTYEEGSGIWVQRSVVRDQGSRIRDQGSGIRDHGSRIRDQGSGFTLPVDIIADENV